MAEAWFERKVHGYGWVPVAWQGWVLTLVWAAFSVSMYVLLPRWAGPNLGHALALGATVLSAVLALLVVRRHLSREVHGSVRPLRIRVPE